MNALATACLIAGILANAGLIWTAKWHDLRGGDATAFTFVLFAVASLLTLSWSLGTGALRVTGFDPRVIGLGMLPGAFSAIAFAALVTSFHYGHSGLSSVVASLHIAVPVVVGIVAFGEIPGLPERGALALIFLSLSITLGYRYYHSRDQNAPMPGMGQWVIWVLLALLFNGLSLSSLGLWGRWAPATDYSFFMTCYYSAGTGVLAAVMLTSGRRVSRVSRALGSLAAVASCIGVLAFAVALGMPTTPISLFVPATVSGYTFVAMAGAELLFKERAALVEWLAAGFSITGIFILSLSGASPG